jgi:DNA repair protein RecO (recombination protein O)
MPTINDNAVCLRRWDYSETSQTVCLFTRQHGIVRGIAKGAKRISAKFSGGFDVLTRGEIVAIVKQSVELATLTEWHLEEVYRAIRQNLIANRAGVYIADVVHHMLTDHDPHPRLYDELVAVLEELADSSAVPSALLRLQWSVLCECGYQPALDCDAETGEVLDPEAATLAFSPRAGGVVCDTGTNDRWRVRPPTIELLRCHASGQVPPSDPEALDRANLLLAHYLRELIGKETAAWRWAWER